MHGYKIHVVLNATINIKMFSFHERLKGKGRCTPIDSCTRRASKPLGWEVRKLLREEELELA